MDRVPLDANVLFSAADSPDSGLRALWRRRRLLLVSDYVVVEATRNPEAEAAHRRLETLLTGTERVLDAREPVDAAAERRLPENDRPVLRAATAARASHLLSGDRRAFGAHYGARLGGVLILRPADYLGSRRR